MSNTHLWFVFASKKASETMFPPDAPFFLKAWGTSRFPTPLHTYEPESGS